MSELVLEISLSKQQLIPLKPADFDWKAFRDVLFEFHLLNFGIPPVSVFQIEVY